MEAPSDLVGWVRTRARSIVVITLAGGPDWLLLSDIAGIGGDAFIVALLPEQDGVLGSQAVRAGAHSCSDGMRRQTGCRGSSKLGRRAGSASINVVRELDCDVERSSPPTDPTTALVATHARGRRHSYPLAELEGYSERAMYRMLQRLYAQIEVKTRTEALIRAQMLGWLAADGRE